MKKLLSMILALAMVLALSTTVFAANLETGEINGERDAEVKANYQAAGEPSFSDEKVYYVKVAWEQSGTLKYSEGSTTYKWNAKQNKYEKDDATSTMPGWNIESAKVTVTVTNQSNATVTAAASVTNKDGFTVTGSFDNESVTLSSAAPEAPSATNLSGTEQKKTMVYTITAVTGTISSSDTAIATLTITLTHD